MTTIKELEAAFERDLLLAGARIKALSIIERAIGDLTDLGFRVDSKVEVLVGHQYFDLSVFLHEFAGGVSAEASDFGEPDITGIWNALEDFLCLDGQGPELVDPEGFTPVAATPDLIHAAQAEVASAPEPAMPDPAPAAAPIAQANTEPKPDYQHRYANLIPASDPLTAADRAKIIAMNDSGASSGEIAAALGRDPRGFYHIVRREVAAANADAKEQPKPVVARKDAVPNLPDAPPVGTQTSASLHARLDRLGNKGKWADPADDLFLVENLAKGVRLAQIAADLDIDAAACKLRYELLVPSKSAGEQEAVAVALRERAKAARAA